MNWRLIGYALNNPTQIELGRINSSDGNDPSLFFDFFNDEPTAFPREAWFERQLLND